LSRSKERGAEPMPQRARFCAVIARSVTMAVTPESETAGSAKRGAARSGTEAGAAVAADLAQEDLQNQIEQLRSDIKSIANTLQRMGSARATQAQGRARSEVRHLVDAGQQMVEDVSDEFGQVEKQIKDTIREKPLTAVISALGIGFLLAVLTR
jgi:ElaB/YqjD/DUF883 family membrane-anchored ribosome-binding protein